MKKIFNFYAAFIACTLIAVSCKKENYPDKEITAQEPPQSVAGKDELLRQLPKEESNLTKQNWRAISKTPLPFKPFAMADKNGRPVQPNEVMTLPDGKQTTAAEYFREINEIEQQLNNQGYSLRNNEEVVASEMVNNGTQKDSDPVSSFEESDAPAASMATTGKPVLLKKVNNTFSKDWSYGSDATFKAALTAKINAQAKIYTYNPASNSTLTELKAIASSRLTSVVAGTAHELFNANGEFYAPADITKNMTAKLTVTSGPTTVLNLNQSYLQNKTFAGTIGTNIKKEVAFEVPIIDGFNFTGKLGVQGRADLQYSATLNRNLSSVQGKPVTSLSGYAEGSINGGILEGGVTGSLTFVSGFLDLKDSIGIFSQNTNQIVVRNGYYFGYDLKLVKGSIKCYAKLCLPLIGCNKISHTIYSADGYVKAGTLFQGTKEYVIINK